MDVEEDNNAALRTSRMRFLGYIVGFFLTFSAFLSILNLQSSINIKDGLGTISAAVSYTVCSIFMIFFTPILLRVFGPKKCLIASEFAYMIYVIANIHPEYYTLIPAATIVGVAEAISWPSMSLLNVYYAQQYADIRKHPTKERDFYVNLRSGYFFTAFQCCRVFGNLITYAVLYGFSGERDVGEDILSTTTTTTANASIDRYQYCGAQDCQNEDIVTRSIDQYVPTDRLAVNVSISIMTVMCFIAQILHCYILPANTVRPEMNKTILEKSDKDNRAHEHDTDGSDLATEKLEGRQEGERKENSNRGTSWIQYTRALKDLFMHMKDMRQILVIPITLYLGLTQGFILAELTRAYSSCVVGVSMVGLHIATYGITDAVVAYLVAKLGHTFGRTPCFFISTLIDAGCYCYCLLWNPTPDGSWSTFFVYVGFGLSDGIWQTSLNVLYLEYFKSKHDLALTMWSFWISVGLATQFAWSRSMCVYVKIYLQLLLLAAGMLCYGLAERINRKKKSQMIVGEIEMLDELRSTRNISRADPENVTHIA